MRRISTLNSRGTRRAAAFIILAIAGTLIAGCSSTSTPEYSDDVTSTKSFDDLLRPDVTVTGSGNAPLIDKTVGVMPGMPITVKAANGRLTSVELTGDGDSIPGKISKDGSTWVSNGTLGFGETYTIAADASGMEGVSGKKVSFTTSEPSQLTDAYLLPNDGETVGIGQPVAIQFDEPITDKKAAQNAITVRTDPNVEGAFYWISDTEVRWRPEKFWKPGTKVHVAVNTKGIDLGDGMYGDNNVSSDFTIGRSFVATADDATKTISIRVDGKVVKTMPTSMGKDSTPTNNGTYIVAERVDSVVMDSSTYGVPVSSSEGYKEVVYDATRMSYSGIYLHAAPWSLGDQGVDDVSNGCLNVSPEDAAWFKDNALRGDIVIAKNTVGPPLPGNDGLGDWNVPWNVWKQGDA